MRLEDEIKKLKDRTADIMAPGFSYYEQELIRRVFKSLLLQFKDKRDISTANDILKKTEWLDV
jgi:hypothetical protein